MTGAKVSTEIVRVIGWGLVYLVLAGAIKLELDWRQRNYPSLPVPKPVPAARVDYPIQPEFTLLPLEQGFSETTARPMFTPFRSPPPPPAQAKPAMQKGQFVLLGALTTKDKSIALLRDVATGKAMRVEQGNAIKGITVSNVYPEKVILTQYDDNEELVLKIQQMPKQFAAPNVVPNQQAGRSPPATLQPPSPPASSMTPSELGRTLINERRASHGQPPI